MLMFALGIVFRAAAQFTPHDVLFYNNSEIYIDSNLIHIAGYAETDGPASILENNGEFYVHDDTMYVTDEGFTIDNAGFVRGNGYYEIESDWTNNSPNFIANQSTVHLFGNDLQRITGTEETTYNVLVTTGNGTKDDRKKLLTINAIVGDSLSITDREIATDTFKLFVTNTELTSVTADLTPGNQGFVSSEQGVNQSGAFSRRTAVGDLPYFFPTGSSFNPPGGNDFIYRPVEVTVQTDNVNRYEARFTHEDPTLSGYDVLKLDDELCSVNPRYFHIVNHTQGFDTANLAIWYNPLEDDIFDKIAQWNTVQDTIWNNTAQTASVNAGGAFEKLIINDWTVFSADTLPFALSDVSPEKPTIDGPSQVCSGSLNLFTASGITTYYEWDVPNNFEIITGENSDSLIVQLDSTGGYINLVALSASGKCAESADSFQVVVTPAPEAGLIVDTNNVYARYRIQFTDNSQGSPVEWFWNFGDGETSTSPTPKHGFDDVGSYIVQMFVKDDFGCIDSTSTVIHIIEGISIPNVFTPNGDGSNDIFIIANSGIGAYHIQIFNRWGQLVFETTAPEISWDGYTNAGLEVPEGTYFYVLEAASDVRDYTTKGFLTLFR